MKWLDLLIKILLAIAHLLFATWFAPVFWSAIALAFLWWAFRPNRKLPHNRQLNQWLRVKLRLHPGPGFATLAELHFTWGRFAMFRKSKRARADLNWRQRARSVHSHSVRLGRAHYRHAVHIPTEVHVLIKSPPRKGKSAALARWILRYPGPVVNTTVKADIFRHTSGIRARSVHWVFTWRLWWPKFRICRIVTRYPIHVFNPQRIGRIPSTFAINIVPGCERMSIAMRRASVLCNATKTGKMEDGDWFKQKAGDLLAGLLHAAAILKADLRLVAQWALADATRAQKVLAEQANNPQMAVMLDELHNNPAEKTAATFRMIMSQIFNFLADPELAQCVLPVEGTGFDIEAFIRGNGTLYMITDSDQEQSPLAPMFALILDEIKNTAVDIGQQNKHNGGRLEKPLGFFLDEITQTAPCAVNKWLASAGGLGLQIWSVFHGDAQIEDRYGEKQAQVIRDCSDVKVILPGVTDHNTLEKYSKILGDVSLKEKSDPFKEKDGGRRFQYPVLTAGMIRALPSSFGLVIRGNLSPVIIRLPKVWNCPEYRWAKLRHRAIAQVEPVRAYTSITGPVTITIPDQRIGENSAADQVVNTIVDAGAGQQVDVDLMKQPDTNGSSVNGHHNGRAHD